MRCSKCGMETGNGGRFCMNCGAPVQQNQQNQQQSVQLNKYQNQPVNQYNNQPVNQYNNQYNPYMMQPQKKKSPVLFIVLGIAAFFLVAVIGVGAFVAIKAKKAYDEYEEEQAMENLYNFKVRNPDGTVRDYNEEYDPNAGAEEASEEQKSIGGKMVQDVIDDYNSTDDSDEKDIAEIYDRELRNYEKSLEEQGDK